MAVKLFTHLTSFYLSNPTVYLKSSRLTSKVWGSVRSVSSLSYEETTNRLVINWKDESCNADEFPIVWLRDNCQCSECFASSSQSRAINLGNFRLDHKPKNTVSLIV